MSRGRGVAIAAQYFVVTAWLVVAGYLGVAGWVAIKALEDTSRVRDSANASSPGVEYHGHTFQDEASVLAFIREQRSTRLAPWIFELPADVIPLLACVAIGMGGGAARLLKVMALEHRPVSARRLYGDPVFGGVIGVFVVVVAWALPALITTGRGPLRAESLAACALCGGFFSERAYEWLERAAEKLFARR